MDYNFSLQSPKRLFLNSLFDEQNILGILNFWEDEHYFSYLNSNHLNPSLNSGLGGTILLLLKSYEITRSESILSILDVSLQKFYCFLTISNTLKVAKKHENYTNEFAFILAEVGNILNSSNLLIMSKCFQIPFKVEHLTYNFNSEIFEGIKLNALNTSVINSILFKNTFFRTFYVISLIDSSIINKQNKLFTDLKTTNKFIDNVTCKHLRLKGQIEDVYALEKGIEKMISKSEPLSILKPREVQNEKIIQNLVRNKLHEIESINLIKSADLHLIKSKWNWTKFFSKEESGNEFYHISDNFKRKPEIIETLFLVTTFRFQFDYKHLTLTRNHKIVLSCFDSFTSYRDAYLAFENLFELESNEDIQRTKKLFYDYVRSFISSGILIKI